MDRLWCRDDCEYFRWSFTKDPICYCKFNQTGNTDDIEFLQTIWDENHVSVAGYRQARACQYSSLPDQPVERTSVLTLSFTLPAEKNAYDIAAHAIQYARAWQSLKDLIQAEIYASACTVEPAESVLKYLQKHIADLEQDYTLPRPE